MDNRDFGNIWQHSFALPQPGEYHRPEDATATAHAFRDHPIRDITASTFLFPDYDPTFLTNFGQSFAQNFTGQHYVPPLPQIPDSGGGSGGAFGTLPIRQMTAATPIPSTTYPCAPTREFTVPLPPRLITEPSQCRRKLPTGYDICRGNILLYKNCVDELDVRAFCQKSYSLTSLDSPSSFPPTSAKPVPRHPMSLPSSTVVQKTVLDQPCLVCLAAASNGLHFGAKTCAACAAFFRRTVSDQKSYICKRSQRCIGKVNDVTGYRKICRSCRMKRCLDVGMIPENVQNKRQRREYPEDYSYQQNGPRTAADEALQAPVTGEKILEMSKDGEHSDQPECII